MSYRKRKYRRCREWFMPPAHNAYHQRHASDPCQSTRWQLSQSLHKKTECKLARIALS
jgi:hypothetical protein